MNPIVEKIQMTPDEIAEHSCTERAWNNRVSFSPAPWAIRRHRELIRLVLSKVVLSPNCSFKPAIGI